METLSGDITCNATSLLR